MKHCIVLQYSCIYKIARLALSQIQVPYVESDGLPLTQIGEQFSKEKDGNYNTQGVIIKCDSKTNSLNMCCEITAFGQCEGSYDTHAVAIVMIRHK